MTTELIALASVISTGLVAVGSFAVTYLGQREQRRHEAQLAFEQRAWNQKVETLVAVVEVSREIAAAMHRDDPKDQILALSRASGVLPEHAGSIELYANAECRSAYRALLDALHLSRAHPGVVTSADRLLTEAGDLHADGDEDRAEEVMRDYFDLFERMGRWFRYEPVQFAALADALVEAGRNSVHPSPRRR